MQHSLRGAVCNATGSFVCTLFVQEDRLFTPTRAETITHWPMIIEQETAEVVHAATTTGSAGMGLKRVLRAVREGSLRMCLVIDNADSGKANLKNARLMESLLKHFDDSMAEAAGLEEPDPSKILYWFARCDGHQLHLIASVALNRSGVQNALYSGALLLRAGHYKFYLHRAIEDCVKDELVFMQGGEQRREDRQFAELCLKHTLLRHCPEREQRFAVPGETPTAMQKTCDELLDTLNCNWLVPRVSHRCRWILDARTGVGRWCCRNRRRI